MPLGAPSRVLPHVKPEPHLSLVDNIGIGATIVNEAQKQQDALQGAPPADPVQGARHPRRGARRPRTAPVEVTQLNGVTKGIALLIAAGDWSRCELVRDPDAIGGLAVKVHNNPIRGIRSAGRTRDAR